MGRCGAAMPRRIASVELRVLGCCGGWSAAGRPCSGYLLTTARVRVWVDAGSGTFAELLRYTGLADLDAVWISHLHPDHVVDVTQAWQAIRYGGARPAGPLPVYGPPGWAARVGALLPEPASAAFDVRELRGGQTTVHGDVELTALAVPHDVPAFGLRAVAGGRVLAYSGDCGDGPDVEAVAAGADLFLCEAHRALPGEPDPPGTVKTPEQAGRAAARAGARSLVLTHLHPAADPNPARDRAAGAFPGPVAVAEPGASYEVGP
jgi:ribonuclease BN (tRNA processing enzyme)